VATFCGDGQGMKNASKEGALVVFEFTSTFE
jgi:hypothetical protein